MVDKSGIREGMQVIASDGGMVGQVLGLHGDHIHVEPTAPVHGGDHTVPRKWVDRVDDHVHLNRDAALVRDTWGSGEGHERPAAAVPPRTAASATAVREPAHKGMGKSWIVWLLGAILLLLIIVLGVRGCGYAAQEPNYQDNAKGQITDADRTASGAAGNGQ